MPVVFVISVVGLACALTVLGFLGRMSWLGDLASHFRLQYAWVLLLAALILSVAHRGVAAVVAGSFALLNLSLMVPLYAERETRPAIGAIYRALSANILSSNRAYDRVRRLIRDTNPDFIALMEVTTQWLNALRELEQDYPFSKGVVLSGGFGILLASRIPFVAAEVVRLGGVGLPSVIVRIEPYGRQLTVVATHPLAPSAPARKRVRDQQLAAIAEFALSVREPLMVLGDLNTTSWAPAFQDVLCKTRLRDSRRGFGVHPTWPTAWPFLRIPIDHCLVSPEVVVHRRQVYSYAGSDHSAIVVDFSIHS